MAIAIEVKVPLVTILDKHRLMEARMLITVTKIFVMASRNKTKVTIHLEKTIILPDISLLLPGSA